MQSEILQLSAILVVGSRRARAQRALDSLGAQTRADDIEIIVVDRAAEGTPPLAAPPRARWTYLVRPSSELWAAARAEGVRHARSPIVAFIEDHCIAAPDWADAIVQAHRGPWVAVGYAFTNPNPQSYVGRASMIADYAPWAHPARRGPTALLPSNNVSYKRDALLALGADLDLARALDFNIQEALVGRGGRLFLESRALAAHENFTRLGDLVRANHVHARLLAANRARPWGAARRTFYGVAAPLAVPTLRLARLAAGMRGRRPLWSSVLMALPVVVLCYFGAAVGETLGYLLGDQGVERTFTHWELESERIS